MSCLRWDFGFTCPFCMLHEGDLSEHDTSGQALIWVEHLALKSEEKTRANEYDNCFLSCRFCNNTRGKKPATDEKGRKLLNPTQTAWADHFGWDGDYLKPNPMDADAEYTWQAYRLDDEKQKVPRRRMRRLLIEMSLDLLKALPELVRKLDQEAHSTFECQDSETAREKLAEARKWQRHLGTTLEQLQRYRAIPRDAPKQCQCGNTQGLTLPDWLSRQALDVLGEIPGSGLDT